MAAVSPAPLQVQDTDDEHVEKDELDASASFRLTGAARRMQVLLQTNALLDRLGFGARSFEDYDDLVASVSSMSVALYEKLFQFRLEGVVRVPSSAADYAHNAQLVVDALSGALLDEDFDAAHLSGESLCSGDVDSIAQLVRMLEHIHDVLYGDDDAALSRSATDPNPNGSRSKSISRQSIEERTSEHTTDRSQAKKKKTNELTTRRTPLKSAGAKKRSTASTTASRARASTSSSSAKRSDTKPPSRASSAPGSQTSRAKESKRTRQENRPSNSSVSRSASSTTRRLPRRSSTPNEDDASLLLTTQKYGRFVPVSGGEGDDQDDTDADEFITPGLTTGGPTYFGDVSSVSGASGSEASVHFMEEEGEFARDFSEMPSHSSPATSKESPGGAEAESESKVVNSGTFETPTRSRNQEDADLEEEQREKQTEESSPVRKKHATSTASASPTIAPKRKTMRNEGRPQPSTLDPLYPLLPETTRREQVVKAQTEFQRYKLQLKSHLQQLRHREFCQRKHLERAYRLGEHAATVERIRTQRFTQDLRLHRLSLGLATQRAEEQQLRDAMKHLLHLEREKLRDEHRSTTQTLRQLQRDHAERERALENYYATQLELVREQTQRELTERQIVEKAHRQASAQMLKELRQDRERQLVATLEQRRHLEEVRRVRRATWLDHALEKQQTTTRKRQDAFYVAAMKARDLRQRDSASTTPHTVTAVYSRRRR